MATTPVPPTALPDALDTPAVGRGPRAPTVVALLVVALSGVVSAAVVPRGPVTGTQVAVLITTATLVGALVGWGIRSRWAIVAAPTLHVAVWELTRATLVGLDGLTFGRPRLDVTMGVLVFVAVHVMYVVVAGLPMLLGVVGGDLSAPGSQVDQLH